jgi:predicted PurR-regulated permease PerM
LENSFSHRSGASRAVGVIHSINQQIANYLNIKTGISALTGIVVAGFLLFFGVDFALFWGLLTFLLNFIPSFGSVLATIPPIIISFVQFETLAEPLAIMFLLISTQVFVGNVLEPKVMGDSLGMSPLIVVLALIFWGWLWGPVGMILSVPIISVFRITCENIDVLNPVGRFLNEPKMR